MNKGQELLEAVDRHGEIGILDLATKPADAADENVFAVQLGSGETIFIEADRLTATASDKFTFDGDFQDVQRRAAQATAEHPNQSRTLNNQSSNQQNPQNLAAIDAQINERGEIVVPLIAEEIKISKKTVETGGVRVHKTVSENVQQINEPIIREHLDIERVEINQFVETAPAIRYEGDVMIVPVLEEVVVTQKRLLLREEIRLTKRREEIANVQEITLRREEISLEKIGTDNIEPGTPER